MMVKLYPVFLRVGLTDIIDAKQIIKTYRPSPNSMLLTRSYMV